MVGVNYSIATLRAGLNDFPFSTGVPLNYATLQSFHFFRWVVLLYLLLPTLLLVGRVMLFSWAYAWLDPLLRQGLYLAMYVAIATAFSPTDKQLYAKPFDLQGGPGDDVAVFPAARLRWRRRGRQQDATPVGGARIEN